MKHLFILEFFVAWLQELILFDTQEDRNYHIVTD